jgi:hypothetical protein
MPFIRDSRTRPIRCPEHFWIPEAHRFRCTACGLVNDPAQYGHHKPTNSSSAISAIPLGSPYLQSFDKFGMSRIKAGEHAVPESKANVKSRLRGSENSKKSHFAKLAKKQAKTPK